MEKTLEELIERESFFEDSALEDAIAYASKIINGSNRFKKEKQNGTERTHGTEESRSTRTLG